MVDSGSFLGSSDPGDSITIVTYATPNTTIKGGVFRAPRGSFTIKYGLIVKPGGSFIHNSGTVTTVGDCGCGGAAGTFEMSGNTLFNVNDSRSWGATVHVGTTVVEGFYIIDNGGHGAYGSIVVHGDFSVLRQTSYDAQAFITLAGTGDQTITHTGGAFPRRTFTINKPSGNVILASDVSMADASQLVNLTAGNVQNSGYAWSLTGTLSVGASQLVDLGGGSLTTKSLSLNSGAVIDLNGGSLMVNSSPVTAGPYGLGTVTD